MNNQIITNELSKYFFSNKVEQAAPFYPLIEMLAEKESLQWFLTRVMENRILMLNSIYSFNVICYIIQEELDRDYNNKMAQFYEKYITIFIKYVEIVFSQYLLTSNEEPKKFGVEKINVEMNDKVVNLYFDGRIVVYEIYKNRKWREIVRNFLGRIDSFHEKFSWYDLNVNYSHNSIIFYERIIKKTENFNIHHIIEYKQHFKLYICIISVKFNNRLFAVVGVDKSYHLCAESIAKEQASHIVSTMGAVERISNEQFNRIDNNINEKKNNDDDAKVIYYTRKFTFLNVCWYLTSGFITYCSDNNHYVFSIARKKKNAEYSTMKKVNERIKNLKDDW